MADGDFGCSAVLQEDDGADRVVSGTTTVVADLRERLADLPANTALEFLVGVRKVSNEMSEKISQVESERFEIAHALPEKLEMLKSLQRDLLEMRGEVEMLRDGYMSHAAKVLNLLQQHCPSVIPQLETLSEKQAKLRRLKCIDRGEKLISALQLPTAVVDENELARIEEAVIAAIAHVDVAVEADVPVSVEYSGKLNVELSELDVFAIEEMADRLAELHYPFETAVDLRGLESRITVFCNMLCILYRIAEWRDKSSGYDAVCSHLFEPLRKHFHFHFYGDRKTNDLWKPQWYFTQLLSWIQTCLPFFETVIIRCGKRLGITVAPVEYFHKQISLLAVEKNGSMLKHHEVMECGVLFAHLIDETISFEEQRALLDIGEYGTNVLSVFCQSDVLQKWLRMENTSCIARIDDILLSEDRWQGRFRSMDDADNYRLCECADSFVSLLNGLQTRAQFLPDSMAQCRFVELQLLLVDDFFQRLTQIAREAESPWMLPFPHVMNAIWYLHDVVVEWSDTCLLAGILTSSGDRTVFDETAGVFRAKWKQFADSVAEATKMSCTSAARDYQQQKWTLGSSLLRSEKPKELSPGFCPLLMKIRSLFDLAATSFSVESLPALFKRLTTAVANLVLEEVVHYTIYDAEGAMQMLYDVEHGLIPVLNHIFSRSGVETKERLNAAYDSQMTVLLSSLRLLTMSAGVLELLSQELENVTEEVSDEKLLSMKLSGLNKKMTERLLTQRKERDRQKEGFTFRTDAATAFGFKK